MHHPHTRPVRQNTPVVRDDDRDIHGGTGRRGAQFGGVGAVHHALPQRQDAGGTGEAQAEPHGHASGVANENQRPERRYGRFPLDGHRPHVCR